jgi:4'-phosphopantetheinyl transferase EntD
MSPAEPTVDSPRKWLHRDAHTQRGLLNGSPSRGLVCRVMLASIVPVGVVAEEITGLVEATFPGEEEFIADAVPSRQREFIAGRACARRALTRLGRPPMVIPVGPHREPMWPPGVVGSITHCADYCAVAEQTRFAALGVDAEIDEPLPDGVLPLIAAESERCLAMVL